jgi:hypothetical protein
MLLLLPLLLPLLLLLLPLLSSSSNFLSLLPPLRPPTSRSASWSRRARSAPSSGEEGTWPAGSGPRAARG